MTDKHTTIADLRHEVEHFVNERDWWQFHTPKNLSMAIAIEAAELMECYQWLDDSDWDVATSITVAEAMTELADVVIYCLALANALHVDLSTIVKLKIKRNAKKYPADEWRGRAR